MAHPLAKHVRIGGGGSLAATQGQLASRILSMTDNGDEVIRFFLGVMRDESVRMNYRLAAAEWLANRMWGKEPAVIHLNTQGIFETLLMASDEELLMMARGEFGELPQLTDPAAQSQAGAAPHENADDNTDGKEDEETP